MPIGPAFARFFKRTTPAIRRRRNQPKRRSSRNGARLAETALVSPSRNGARRTTSNAAGLAAAVRDGAHGAVQARRLAHAAARRSKPLAFAGLATNGGADEDDYSYWVDALFRPEQWLVYSAAACREVVLCAGVLEGALGRGPAPPASQAARLIKRTREGERDWMVRVLRAASEMLAGAGVEVLARCENDSPEDLREMFAEVVGSMDDDLGCLDELARRVDVARRVSPSTQQATLQRLRRTREAAERSPAPTGRRRHTPYESLALRTTEDGVLVDRDVEARSGGDVGAAVIASLKFRRPKSSCRGADLL